MIKQINYKKLNFYKKGHQFTLEIYKTTIIFPKEEIYSLTSQIRRASTSICANISEGSVKSQIEFRKYLKISLGSAKECEYWLLLSKDLKYISIEVYKKLINILNIIIGSLTNYIKIMKV